MSELYHFIAKVVYIAIFGLLVGVASCYGQNALSKVELVGNKFIEKSSTKGGKIVKTKYLYEDSKGNVDTVYLSPNGKAFVWKVSQKTGNKYKKYLPHITKQINDAKKTEDKSYTGPSWD